MDSCFICCDETPPFVRSGCTCKGTMNSCVHAVCLRKVVTTFQSPVCRTCKNPYTVSYCTAAKIVIVSETVIDTVWEVLLYLVRLWHMTFVWCMVLSLIWSEQRGISFSIVEWFGGVYFNGILYATACLILGRVHVFPIYKGLFEFFLYFPLFVHYDSIVNIWRTAQKVHTKYLLEYGDFGE